ncbi:MAG: hypothetical protein FWH56_02540 [Betaproteobacteria bacterium]|nr:hypothetical protein [Betaproteobacteria bacterium]
MGLAGNDLFIIGFLIQRNGENELNLDSDPMFSGKKKVFFLRLGIGVGVLAVLALAAPLIWSAVSAGVGLIIVFALALLAIGIVQALPLLGQKWENRLLTGRKNEARKNPIEQLQNFLQKKAKRVALFRQAVIQIGTQIKGLGDMLEERRRTKPGYDASKQEAALASMRQAHQALESKYRRAEEALDQLREVIDDKKFEWSFGKAGQAAMAQLNAASGEDLFNKMLADEAFASVRDNFNQVFAELELEAGRLNSQNQLTFGDGMTIDLSAIHIPEQISAR